MRDLRLRTKLMGSCALVLVFMIAVSVLAIGRLGDVRDRGARTYAGTVVPLDRIGQVRGLLGDIDSQIQRAITDRWNAGRTDYAGIVAADAKGIDELLAAEQRDVATAAERASLARFEQQWPTYQRQYGKVLDAALAGDVRAATRAYFAGADDLYLATDTAMKDLSALNVREARTDGEAVEDAYAGALRETLALLAIAVLVCALVGWLVSRSVTHGMADLLATARAFARGDVRHRVTVDQRDEVGELGDALRELTTYVEGLATAADRVARGDLSRPVEPLGDDDVLGTSFAAMTGSLRELVGRLSETAHVLGDASQQMAATSEETGRAVAEIAQAVGEVASGAERQVRTVEEAQAATAEVTRATEASAQSALQTAAAAAEAHR
ncbi:MAG TPA: methyl-accepting chemotaxis protein, partial [Solirubrobacteraceae bacterium]|nr:methyl-accepting chemotaxis protein [Solirubrobacteraceae bacterium]